MANCQGVCIVSEGGRDNLPRTGWLETGGVDSLAAPEARSPEGGCGRGHAGRAGSGGGALHASSSSWWFPCRP